jgi:CRISPR system Cascade subunit CasB
MTTALHSPPDSQTQEPPEGQFARALQGLSIRATKGEGTARARLARLRRALGRRGVEPIAFREVGEYLGGVKAEERDTYLLVAALFALHAAKSDRPWYVREGSSLGLSCKQARKGAISMDLRFAALLDARHEDLPYRLRQVVALLAAQGVGVRYDVLLRDLLDWDEPRRPVQSRWAADYWTPGASSPRS